jgi:hypothetical protein
LRGRIACWTIFPRYCAPEIDMNMKQAAAELQKAMANLMGSPTRGVKARPKKTAAKRKGAARKARSSRH